jgi:hypothetical protein
MKTKNLYICLMALFSITAFANGYNEYGNGGGGGGYGGGSFSTNSDAANGGYNGNYAGLNGSNGAYGSNNTGNYSTGGTTTMSGNNNGGFTNNPNNNYTNNPSGSPTTTTWSWTKVGSSDLNIWGYTFFQHVRANPNYYANFTYAAVVSQVYGSYYANQYNGGSNTTPTSLIDPHITNVVNDPCIKSAVSKVISGSATNPFTQILNGDFFKEDYQSLTFTEYNDNSVEEIKVDGKRTGGQFNQNIRLNLAALDNASQEYMVATIYHEIIHAQLVIQGISAEIAQHEIIATSWRQKISDQLRIDFPNLSRADADGLAWGGLGDTTQWQTMFNNDKSNNTGITGAIAAVNSNHKNVNNSTNGNYGTPCTN